MKYISFLLLATFLGGCGLFENKVLHDPSQNLTREDFKDLNKPQDFFEEAEEIALPIFPIKQRSGLAVDLIIEGKTTVSEIAKKITAQLKIGHMIQKDKEINLSYSVKGRDIEDVLEDLEDLTGLVFELTGQMLAVRENNLIFKTYECHHLALNRNMSSDLSINTDSTGAVSKKSGNASQTKVTSDFQNNFWQELNQTIAQILGIPPISLGSGKEIKKNSQETLASYSLNRQSGQITVYAKYREHRIIEEILEKIKIILGSQIHIEAKVVEIQLNDEYRSGINWSSLRKTLDITGNMGSIAKDATLPGIVSTNDGYKFTLKKGKEFKSILSLMENFGTVRTLSSPRLTVLNNHAAILKVADNLTFFRVKTDIRTNYSNALTNGHQEYVTSESQIETVPVGFIMTVQPSIDPTTQEILLYLKPTITSVKQLRNDPAVDLTAKRYNLDSVKSEIPVISVREIDSILRMDSGSIAILGGLMQEKSQNISSGIPGFHETPLRFLTHGKANDHVITELVIFIKASIARSGKKNAHDTHLYQKFFSDPRPFNLSKKAEAENEKT
jgi:general secretion pathway protein D